MRIHKSIDVSDWNEQTLLKMRQYWEECGFKLEVKDAMTFSGLRGSWWNTLMSISYSSVRTELSLRRDGNRLDCSMHIDTRFRAVTLWHRKLLELELATFESFLLRGDRQLDAWTRYHQESKHAIQEAVGDNLGHLFRKNKPDTPMQIGGDLVFKIWVVLAAGAILSMVFLFCGDELFSWLHMLTSKSPLEPYPGSPYMGAFAAVLAGVFFAVLAVWTYSLHSSSQQCINVEQAATQLSMDPGVLQKAIEQRSVKAKYIMDGEPVYDLAEITGAATLLRPAEEPGETILLMPAARMGGESTELLIRPSTVDSCRSDADANYISLTC